MRRLGILLIGAVICSGCFRSTTTITVKQDGSGVIDQDIGATAQAMALLRNFGGAAGGDKPAGATEMFGPEQAKTAAAAMGVRFVSGEPIKSADLEGYRAHFAFDDVTQVRLNPTKTPGSTAVEADKTSEPPFVFGFSKRDGASVLTIKVAEQKAGGGVLPPMPGRGASPQDSAQALAMIGPMLRGLFVDVSLVVDGRVIKTNAPYVEGSKLTLLQFDFDKVNATDGALQKLQQVTDMKMLKDVAGVRVVTDPVVTIEFGR